MVRKDGAETRKERIQGVARDIMSALYEAKQQGIDHIGYKKTVSLIMYNYGLTREKAVEYIGLLQDAGKIDVDLEKDQIRYPVV